MNITNSFTQMPNELMEILMSSALNDTEKRILLFVARKTYGFHKASDKISYSQFENQLNLSRQTVVITLSRLRQVGITRLVKRGTVNRVSNEWSIDLSDWESKLVSIGRLVRYNKEKLVGIGRQTKDSITKEKSKEPISLENEHVEDSPIHTHVHEVILPARKNVLNAESYAKATIKDLTEKIMIHKKKLLYPAEETLKSRAYKARFELGLEDKPGSGSKIKPEWSEADKLWFALENSYGVEFLQESGYL